MIIRVLAPAKINLSLHIKGKKNTSPFLGYHLIESLVSFVDICDKITLTPTKDGQITVTSNGDFAHLIPNTTDNLVARAVALIRPDTTYGCQIHIEKNLPVGGGVGGGSSNAGATIKALCKHWNTPPPNRQILATLSADIPMCYAGCDGFVTGIGDTFAPVQIPTYYIVLAYPHTVVATPDIYKHFTTYSTYSTAPKISDTISYEAFIHMLHTGQNDLAPVCLSLYPAVQQCLDTLQQTHADYTNISGSGACCFGIYKNKQCAKNAHKFLKLHNYWAKIGCKI